MSRRIRSYVALGDSFTAGRGSAAGERWADLLAERLTAAEPGLAYANLAVDGAASDEVLDQVAPALVRRPDPVTVVCGANDVLRTSRPDIAAYERNFDLILSRLRAGAPGAAILTATAPDSWRFLELRPRTRVRVVEAMRELNAATRTVADRHSVPCLDVVGHPQLAEPDNFSPDGLHPSALGHRRAAEEIGAALRDQLDLELDAAAVAG